MSVKNSQTTMSRGHFSEERAGSVARGEVNEDLFRINMAGGGVSEEL